LPVESVLESFVRLGSDLLDVGGSLLSSGQPVDFVGEFGGYFDDGHNGYPGRIPNWNALWRPKLDPTVVLVKCPNLAGRKHRPARPVGSVSGGCDVPKLD